MHEKPECVWEAGLVADYLIDAEAGEVGKEVIIFMQDVWLPVMYVAYMYVTIDIERNLKT